MNYFSKNIHQIHICLFDKILAWTENNLWTKNSKSNSHVVTVTVEIEVDSEVGIEADIEEIVKEATEAEVIEEENNDLETATTVGKLVILLEIAPIVI